MQKLKNIINRILKIIGYRLIRPPESPIPFVHQLQFSDTKYSFWITDAHTKSWWYKELQEETAEMEFIKNFCSDEDIVFDVGAHHGYQTIYMAKHVNLGRVHSFEANPICALTLDANVGLNKLTNVSTNLLAIGATSKTIEIKGQSINSESLDSWDVPMISLDSYCTQRAIRTVHMLKIDVEGYEGEVLKGASQLLNSKPHINLELHLDDIGKFGWTSENILNLLPTSDDTYEISWIDRKNDWTERHDFASIDLKNQQGVINIFFLNKKRSGQNIQKTPR